MTPNYKERSQLYEQFVQGADPFMLRELVFNQHIDYIVVSAAEARNLYFALRDLNIFTESCGPWEIIRFWGMAK
jgi:hypothetical protein